MIRCPDRVQSRAPPSRRTIARGTVYWARRAPAGSGGDSRSIRTIPTSYSLWSWSCDGGTGWGSTLVWRRSRLVYSQWWNVLKERIEIPFLVRIKAASGLTISAREPIIHSPKGQQRALAFSVRDYSDVFVSRQRKTAHKQVYLPAYHYVLHVNYAKPAKNIFAFFEKLSKMSVHNKSGGYGVRPSTLLQSLTLTLYLATIQYTLFNVHVILWIN